MLTLQCQEVRAVTERRWLIQHSTQIDRWSSDIRFEWLDAAGTSLSVVFNSVEGIQDLDGNLSLSSIIKDTHQLNILGG